MNKLVAKFVVDVNDCWCGVMVNLVLLIVVVRLEMMMVVVVVMKIDIVIMIQRLAFLRNTRTHCLHQFKGNGGKKLYDF